MLLQWHQVQQLLLTIQAFKQPSFHAGPSGQGSVHAGYGGVEQTGINTTEHKHANRAEQLFSAL